MRDLEIKGTGNSRYIKSSVPASTTFDEFLTMLRAGNLPIDLMGLNTAGIITQSPSAYNKANVLPDDVCSLLGLDSTTAEPKDAWLGVISALGYCVLSITVLDVDGSPEPNTQVSGLTGVVDSKTYTDTNGKILLLMQEGDYTLSVPKMEGCVDATLNPQSFSLSTGEQKNIVFQPVSNNTTQLTITSSRTVKFSSNVASVDVFCCGGGGGGGGGGMINSSNTAVPMGGGGGGGGYTKTGLKVSFTPYTAYNANVGSGGRGGRGAKYDWPDTSSNVEAVDGSSGGTTSFISVSARGGYGGQKGYYTGTDDYGAGGDGGSGGGGGSYAAATGGGTDGGNGSNGRGSGGTGQGTTTRAFGEDSGTLYANGGGGGGLNTSGSRSGYGGGGGGGGSKKGGSGYASTGSNGMSGVIVIRWTRK